MSRKPKYPIKLKTPEREALGQMTRRDRHSSRELNRAHVLLGRDSSLGRTPPTQSELARRLGIAGVTVTRICQRYCQEGCSAAIHDKPRSGRPTALDSHQAAKLTALACSEAPEGHGGWSHQLLAERFVQLELADSVSRSSVGRLLKKTD